MAVGWVDAIANTDANTSATTVPFLAPATVTAGNTWFCWAAFRAGSTVTISGVPGSFTLINRVDSGSATTNCSLICYWYVATGSETASAQFATITLSSASKHVTVTEAFSGCHTTAPTANVVSGGAVSPSIPGYGNTRAVAADEFLTGTNASQGTSTLPGTPTASGVGVTNGVGGVAGGGSGATNVGMTVGRNAGPQSASPSGWTAANAGESSGCGMGFIIVPAPAAAVASLPLPRGNQLQRRYLAGH